ncbi:hypothetical protein O3G_MSEX002891 [Manduca sexta]|uniref:Uncharacterized protein n=1 Tax=Manduca sexta TaxID=7130 RepID=A0A921YQG8_MANSE|nr:hypothetical protein O3G_MSEX002891 [Manduca sexta]
MERNTVPVNIISKNAILSKVREVRRCLLYYNTLLDSVADIDRELQCSENYIGLSYIHLLDMLEGFWLTCMPAIAAELVKKETELMKHGLSKQLVRCSDESLRFELQVALQYMEHRPFNFMLFYAIPLDISLVIGIVSLCITYTIVAMQLKYFNINNYELYNDNDVGNAQRHDADGHRDVHRKDAADDEVERTTFHVLKGYLQLEA